MDELDREIDEINGVDEIDGIDKVDKSIDR